VFKTRGGGRKGNPFQGLEGEKDGYPPRDLVWKRKKLTTHKRGGREEADLHSGVWKRFQWRPMSSKKWVLGERRGEGGDLIYVSLPGGSNTRETWKEAFTREEKGGNGGGDLFCLPGEGGREIALRD